MIVSDVNKVKAAKSNVIIQTVELTEEGNLYFAKDGSDDDKNAEISFGKVIAMGPTAKEAEACPEVNVGESVVFNRYAGSHIVTKNTDEINKVMDGHFIMARLQDINNINEETAYPVANRVLIKVKYVDQDEDGLVFDNASNPGLEDLDYGEIVKVGSSCKLGYKVGEIVAYNTYAGENIRRAVSADIPALRVLNEDDVLLII